ncbi:hypothetical protein J3A83DRAFT_4357612 [Scleroderma citrinum]
MRMTTSSTEGDLDTELLIARLIEGDLQSLKDAQYAEKIQLESVLAVSSFKSRIKAKFTRKRMSTTQDCDDAKIAMEIFLSGAQTISDHAVAEALQVSQEAGFIAGQQLAQKIAAEETKVALDAEFARKLQAAIDGGTMDVDTVDVEALLGREEMECVLAGDPNAKGKGAVRSAVIEKYDQFGGKGKDIQNLPEPNPYPLCGICFDAFRVTYAPVTASQTAMSSSHLNFGLCLPCPGEHSYCQSCLVQYIQSKIAPDGDHSGILEAAVFPIQCPECPEDVWPDGIPDDVAQRILGEKDMVLWYSQKLLDSIERHYCPNLRCSALVQVHEDPNEPMALCPLCQEFMCVPCKVPWHHDLTCEEFQALPDDERSPDDQLVLILAKAKNWRRCPTCSRLVELTHGCHHIACFCGTHFCHKCGALWDRKTSRCTRSPSCDLWDENMLLEERERERVAVRERQQQLRHPVPVQGLEPPPPYRQQAAPIAVDDEEANDLEWLRNPRGMGNSHPFTSQMIRGLMCGYCGTRANSLADLLYHLEHVRHHSVFACCERFFSREIDFERHCNARVKSGRHEHRVARRV